MARGSNVLEIVINASNKAGPTLKRLGSELVKFGGIATAAFGAAAKRAGDFEKGLAEINTLLDGDTTEAMGAMRTELLDMSVQFGQTIGKLTKARYDVISAGFTDAADSAAVLTEANKLAVAGVSDVASTADLLTTAINGLGLQASDAGAVADTLFQTVRKGKTTMDDLAASLGPVFATARVAGVGIDELGAVMATTTAAGVDTRESATALNNLLRALAAPTGAAAAALEEMGINLDDGLLPALQGLATVGEEGLDALAKVIPNIRALKTAAVAASDIEGLNANLESMASAGGVVDEAFAKMQETFDFQTKQLRGSLDALVITVGSAVLPIFRDYIERTRRIVEWVRDNKRAVFELSNQFFTYGIRIAKVGITMLALQKAFIIIRKGAAALNKQTLIAIATIAALALTLKGASSLLKAMGVDFDLYQMAVDGVGSAVDKLKEEFPELAELMDIAAGGMSDLAEETRDAQAELDRLLAQDDKGDGFIPDLPENVENMKSLKDLIRDLEREAKFTRDEMTGLAFSIGDNIGGAIADVASSMIGLTERTMSIGEAFKSIAASIISDLIRIGIRMIIARSLAKKFRQELEAANAAMGGGGGGSMVGAIGTAAGFAIGGPIGGTIGGTIGGLFGAHGTRVPNAARGFQAPGSAMFLPGMPGLDRTLVAAQGGEMFVPGSTVNFAERMLMKTLTSPKGSRARSSRQKQRIKLDVQANRPFRREEQNKLVDSVSDATRRSKRYGRG